MSITAQNVLTWDQALFFVLFFFCFFGSRGKKITSRERHKRDNRERAWSQAKDVLSSKPWWRPVTPAIQYLSGAAHWLIKPVNSRPMPEPLQWDTDDCYNHWTRFQIGCIVLFSGLREGKRYNIDGVLVLVIYSNPEEGGTRDSGEGGGGIWRSVAKLLLSSPGFNSTSKGL